MSAQVFDDAVTQEQIEEDLSGLVNLAACWGIARITKEPYAEALREEVFGNMHKIVSKIMQAIDKKALVEYNEQV